MIFNKENLFQILSALRNPLYFSVIAFGTILSYSLYAIFPNSSLLFSTINLNPIGLPELILHTVTGFSGSVSSTVLLLSVAVSVAVGFNIALVLDSLLQSKASNSLGSVAGASVAGIAPACAACTAGAVSLAGISIPIGLLPFQGIEINVFALILLVFSAFYLVDQNGELCRFKVE